MNNAELTKLWVDIGKKWLDKGISEIGFKKGVSYKFSEKQDRFINTHKYLVLYSGGYRSGKTLAMLVKMVLWCLFFPGTRVLLGRQFMSDIDRVILPDLFDILPSKWYTHRVKDCVIRLFNGSEIVLFGLDALQSGSGSDIKKAEQRIKGLNLSAYFLDQLEEIEEKVFMALNSRLSRQDTPFRQGNGTCNPANFWAYNFFKVNPTARKDIEIIEGSMYDNFANLPPDYIEKQVSGQTEDFVKRYVMGIWDISVIVGKTVLFPEEIRRLELTVREPEAIENGFHIFEQPRLGVKYQVGVDPSEGAEDPSSISVVSDEGKKVASFSGLVPIPALGELCRYINAKYYNPLFIPEVNAAGMALLEYIRDFYVYQRVVVDNKDNTETKKLGWKTSYSSKQQLISNFKRLLVSGFPIIYDKLTVEEFKTFVWSDEARNRGAGAERGFHDDNVIATLLSYWGLFQTQKPITAIEREQMKARKNKKIINYF
jgi:hypothetical protein